MCSAIQINRKFILFQPRPIRYPAINREPLQQLAHIIDTQTCNMCPALVTCIGEYMKVTVFIRVDRRGFVAVVEGTPSVCRKKQACFRIGVF